MANTAIGRPRVVVTRSLPDDILAPLEQLADVELWRETSPIPRQKLLASLDGARGLLCMLTEQIDEGLLANASSLRAVSSMSVGVDHIDVEALTRRRIPLGHTPGVLVETTADLVFGLLLAAARRVCEADRLVRSGQWKAANRWAPDMLLGRDVHGATLGIIGLGAIGQALARRAAGFKMRVLAWTRSQRQLPGVETTTLDHLLAESDFVSVNVALARDTHQLLDAAAIAAMKPGSILVNGARGGIVDERALAKALRSGHLAAAGIDVFEQEPPPADNPLLDLPNVVLAPHIGSASQATRREMANMAVANLCAALQDQPMPHCVNFPPP